MSYGAEGIDDIIRRMQEDEQLDRIEAQTHATPIEYAKARGFAPQKVYYVLRKHPDKLNTELCKCGRKVLNMVEADKYFGLTGDNEHEQKHSEEDEAEGE